VQVLKANEVTLPKCLELGQMAFEKILGRKGFNFPHSLYRWVQMLREGRGAVFYVDIQGTPHGFIAGFTVDDLDTAERTAVVHHWFTRKEASGNGIWLLKAFERWAKSKGCMAVTLGCAVEMEHERTDQLYAKLGYQERGKHFFKRI
jgi:GNAT superfamily N-acetyltransferase